MNRLLYTLILLIFYCTNSIVQSQSVLQEAYPGLVFDRPLFYTSAQIDGKEKAYVIQQNGSVFTFDPSSSQPDFGRSLFLNVNSRLSSSNGEEGLLGFALDPNFANSGIVYVYYTARNTNLVSRLSRFHTFNDGFVADDPQNEEIILEFAQPFSNHNGGMITFGPDGYLYIASGDGGSSGDPNNLAQNLTNLYGKILRIDVSTTTPGVPYSIPSDNPFIGVSGSRPEIYAYGLRNPWRFSFDRQTGQGWIGDVGQNSFEEINKLTAGANYGWRLTEGFACYNPSQNCPQQGITFPIKAYNHQTGGRSITGGYVYRGSASPALIGAYIYGDYVNGRLWLLREVDNQIVADSLIQDTNLNIASFSETLSGELLILAYNNGRIYRFSANVGTGIAETNLPDAFQLGQNYPNPFNPSTVIPFELSVQSSVKLTIHDVLGREIQTLLQSRLQAGQHNIAFDASALGSGVFFYVLETDQGKLVRSMTLIR